ncbi:hypothetical protein ZWY2020_049068 [Hordeum vulgare]|nr:hypothetical protein ZWY2020_049068 [Hordeum vulgare]
MSRPTSKLNERIMSSLSRRAVAAHSWHDLEIEFSPFVGRLSDVSPSANDPRLRSTSEEKENWRINFHSGSRTKEKPAQTQANPTKVKPDDQANLPSSPKEGTKTPNPPSPLKTTEDPDAVIITGTGFSKPTSAVLSKHVSTSTKPSTGHEISKAKLSQYENLEFKELCSGFASRLVTSYEMEKNLLLMMKNKHEVRLNAYPPH